MRAVLVASLLEIACIFDRYHTSAPSPRTHATQMLEYEISSNSALHWMVLHKVPITYT